MHQDKLPEYIKEYRDQSWQFEMLIAGGLVFYLYSITDFFRSYFFDTWSVVNYSAIQILLLFFAYFITRILLFGFIANLLFRAVWLAYLGINFSFPNGIKYDNIVASSFRKEILKLRPNIVQRVILLERLCNLTYSISILLALFSTSIMIIMVSIIWVLELLGFYSITQSPNFTYALAITIAIINSGLLDSLLFRKKSNSKISEMKESVSGVLDYLTLAFLFKREFMVIKSNTRNWLFYFFTFLIIGISLLVSVNQLGKYYPWGTMKIKLMDDREFYDLPSVPTMKAYMYTKNLTKEKVVFRGAIQSDIVKDQYLKLFMVSWHRFENFLDYSYQNEEYPLPVELIGDSKNVAMENINTDSLYNNVINGLFTVYIGKDTIKNLKWRNYTQEVTYQQGYITYIPIDTLPSSEHELRIDVSWMHKGEKKSGTWLRIPFWKE